MPPELHPTAYLGRRLPEPRSRPGTVRAHSRHRPGGRCFHQR
ncbi:hypothetical protein ACFFX0_30995 [Citricoccus parietis]|uniref:Uncharacterized protein n=1 Tax=Citricoccus parietis TaxID=592307 RepID=A0ABV5G8T2_9MICC